MTRSPAEARRADASAPPLDEAARIAAELTRPHGGTDPFASAVRATRMPMIITNPRLPDNPVVFVNDAFCRLTGYAREEIVGRNCRFLQGPETSPAVVARIRGAVAARQSIEIDIRNHRRDGEPFWNRLLVAPVYDVAGELAYFFASQVDVTLERERLAGLETRNAALMAELADRLRAQQESEARLRLATESNGIGTWDLPLGASGAAIVTSARHDAIFGYDAPVTEWGLPRFLAHVVPDDREMVRSSLHDAIAGGQPWHCTPRIRQRTSGALRWIEVHGQPVAFDAQGQAVRFVGVVTDITERKLAEERQALMAREVDHRAKNALAVVQAALRLTKAANQTDYARAVEQRVATLARAQSLLAADRWAGADLHALVRGEVTPFLDGNAQHAAFEGPTVALPPLVAQPLAMVLHELATNAVKHGALSATAGRVAIRWSLTARGDTPWLTLGWVESGGPPVSPPERRGFGSRVVDGVVRRQLGGAVAVDWREAGLRCEIELPLLAASSRAVGRGRAGAAAVAAGPPPVRPDDPVNPNV